MGCASSNPPVSDDEVEAPQAKAKAKPQAPLEAAPEKQKSVPKKPKHKTLGPSKDFPFVDPDHHVPDVWKLFTKERVLGQGASCEVCHVIRKDDKAEFAMKVMERDDKWNPILFKQEVDLLTSLDHPNILKYCDNYMDLKRFYVCTELCKGGELFDKIKELKKFSEREAAKIMYTIIDAIAHCHAKNIVHRDLKPENIVYRTKEQNELVIIDFGDAKEIDDEKVYEDFVGTAFYLAPECVRNRKGWELKKSDMWTIGVIAYVLLTGRPPFYGRGNKEILKKIIRGKVTFPKNCKLSKEAIQFILALIQKEPEKRLSAKDALNHEWLAGHASEDDLGKEVLENLANYSQSCKLKKVLVRMLANQMTDEDHEGLKGQFDSMDADGNGYIELSELTSFILGTGVSQPEAFRRASALMKELDQDGDGKITLEEYADARLSTRLQDEKMISEQFSRIDLDNDGFITPDELATLFNWALSKELIVQMIQEIDKNRDGKISFDEFKEAMKKGAISSALSPRQPVSKELTAKLRKEFAEMEAENGLDGGVQAISG